MSDQPIALELTAILDQLRELQPHADFENVARAYDHGARSYHGLQCFGGEPTFTHSVNIASMVAGWRIGADAVCAALLHAWRGDGRRPVAALDDAFGSDVAKLVQSLDRLRNIETRLSSNQLKAASRAVARELGDVRVVLIKLAGALDGMRTLTHLPPATRNNFASAAKELYLPVAYKLGLLEANELDDQLFEYWQPNEYAQLFRSLPLQRHEAVQYVDTVSRMLQARLREQGFEAEVNGSTKSLAALHRKMQEEQRSVDQIFDRISFRVRMETVSDCYAALGVVHSRWTPIPGRFKDYIAVPKPDLYQSLHTTVIGPGRQRIEIRIRTRQMQRHMHARLDHYSDELGPARDTPWLRGSELEDLARDPVGYLEKIKNAPPTDDVYLFTPKGDVHILPSGGTPVDLAYAIHTEVGNHCLSALANDEPVLLNYKVQNGDVIEILTLREQRPSEEWLSFVATPHARARIRKALRRGAARRSGRELDRLFSGRHSAQSEPERSASKLGRDLLEKQLQRLSVPYELFSGQGVVDRTASELGFADRDDLFAALGSGRLALQRVIEAAGLRAR